MKTQTNPDESQTACHAAITLLESGDYQRAGGIIRNARASSDEAGDQRTLEILDTARRIYMECAKCRAETECHGQVAPEDQDHRLGRELHTMLELIGKAEVTEVPQMSGKPRNGSASAKTRLNEWRSKSYGLGLWKRIRAALRPSRHTPAPDSESFEEPAEQPRSHIRSDAAFQTPESKVPTTGPSLVVSCLGPFQVYQDDVSVSDWPSGKGKSVFKYLVTHRDRPIPKEVLMELFWPEASPRRARNSLNVAIYRLRQALATSHLYSHVLFRDDCYLLNPELNVWVDFEAFQEQIVCARASERRGDQVEAIRAYHAAEALYDGEFLDEDRYEPWMTPMRQRLQDEYLKLLDSLSGYYFEQKNYDACVTACNKILAVDACHEDAHRQLMRCYSRQKRSSLAMRQYQNCVNALSEELGLLPSAPTIELYGRIQNCKPV